MSDLKKHLQCANCYSHLDHDYVCDHCERAERKLLSCARCGLVKYCSKECQRAQWGDHKLLCIQKDLQDPPLISRGSKLLVCSLCLETKYCSVECQSEFPFQTLGQLISTNRAAVGLNLFSTPLQGAHWTDGHRDRCRPSSTKPITDEQPAAKGAASDSEAGGLAPTGAKLARQVRLIPRRASLTPPLMMAPDSPLHLQHILSRCLRTRARFAWSP